MLEWMARNWWAISLRGVFAVLFGVVALMWPGITLGALVLLFGIYALVAGVLGLVSAFSARGRERWGALLVEAFVGIAAGVIAFLWPGLTALALLFVIAFWAIFTGILEVVAAVRLRREIEGEWLLALSGVASLAFGALLVARPAVGALAVVWLIGSYSIVFGLLFIALGLRLRGWRDRAPEVRPAHAH